MRSTLERRLSNLSIPKKLGIMLAMPAIAIGLVLLVCYLGMNLLSSMRSYIGGEGLWSKAQKQATIRLHQYSRSRQQADYLQFLDYLAIPLGDHQARVELEKEYSDRRIVYDGFEKGGNHPADLPGMFALYKNFRHNAYMEAAIQDWERGDQYIASLLSIGDAMHRSFAAGSVSDAQIRLWLNEADDLNTALTPLEDHFSATLGNAARWLKHILLLLTFIVAMLCLGIGLSVMFLVARHMTQQIGRLRTAAMQLAEGDYSQKIDVSGSDEISDLSQAFRHMAQQRQEAEQELESFSYSISHDLRAPLRAIDSFSADLVEDYSNHLDGEGQRLLAAVRRNTAQMSHLIEGLLAFSRLIQRPLQTTSTDMTALALAVGDELRAMEKDRKIEITVEPLGQAETDPTLMRQVFANLLSNAIKFTRHRAEARIQVGRRDEPARTVYFVQDNGAGFDMQYSDRLFGVFQRLHKPEEFEGTGVGLALIQRIIHRHGGEVWAEGRENDGATFYFSLPKTA